MTPEMFIVNTLFNCIDSLIENKESVKIVRQDTEEQRVYALTIDGEEFMSIRQTLKNRKFYINHNRFVYNIPSLQAYIVALEMAMVFDSGFKNLEENWRGFDMSEMIE